MTSDITQVEKGSWNGRTTAYKGVLIFMLFVGSIEMYYVSLCVPVMQDLYPEED